LGRAGLAGEDGLDMACGLERLAKNGKNRKKPGETGEKQKML
jgi:hypothetical protein